MFTSHLFSKNRKDVIHIYALRAPNRTSPGKIPNIIIFQNQIENQNSTLRFYFNINNISPIIFECQNIRGFIL